MIWPWRKQQVLVMERFFCKTCAAANSVRDGSFFFAKFRLPHEEILMCMYFWAAGVQCYVARSMLPQVSKNSLYDLYSFCQDIAISNAKKITVTFTNEEEIHVAVQMDESLFGKSRKYNKGKYFKQEWIFGLSQPDCHKCLLLRVKERTKETLNGLILEHVPKSERITIVSDGWASYLTLQDFGYKHHETCSCCPPGGISTAMAFILIRSNKFSRNWKFGRFQFME